MSGSADSNNAAKVAVLVEMLVQGCEAHGSAAALTLEEAKACATRADKAKATDDLDEHRYWVARLQQREIEVAQHQVGLSTCIGALAIIGALGTPLPEIPALERFREMPPELREAVKGVVS